MLGGKSYTRDEVDHCKAAVDQQLVAYTDKKALLSKLSKRSSSTT
jgi:hypothetical protein